MSNATYNEVKTLDPASLADALYARDFSSATDAAVATTLVTNLGLTSVAGLSNWIAAQLTAAGSHKGAKIVDLLNGFAQMTADATYGAYATAFNASVDAALVLSQTTGNAGGSFAAAGTSGATFTLTTGVDAIVGTAGNDVINAYALNSSGAAATTLSAFDSIDGGAGIDTANIYVDTANNGTFSGTFTNVEKFNIDNTTATAAAAVDASKYGTAATSINQIAKAANVTKLASTTTASFKGAELIANLNPGVAAALAANSTTGSALKVSAASTSTTATVNLDGVKGDAATVTAVTAADNTAGVSAGAENQAVLAVTGAALTGVSVTGTLAQKTTTTGAAAASLALAVTGGTDADGKSLADVAVSSAVKTTLTVANGGTGNVKTVSLAGSTGAITYVGGAAIKTITGGAGADTLTLGTTTVKDDVATTTVDETYNASLNAGAGNDTVTVAVTGTGTTSVNGEDGNDTITLKTSLGEKVAINGGAGDDTVKVQNAAGTARAVGAYDTLTGGDGTDTLVIGATSYSVGDYALIAANVSGFETVQFAAAATADASKFAGFSTLKTAVDGATFTKVADVQTISTAFDVTATSSGYVAKDLGATPAVASTTYAGTLTVKASTAGVALMANTANLSLSVNATAGTATAASAVADVTLTGDAQTATVTLNSVATKTAGQTTASTTDDAATFALTTTTGTTGNNTSTGGQYTNMGGLTSLTLTGNGSAVIVNGAKLATVDASGLVGTSVFDGVTLHNGLTFTGNDTLAETVTLSSGKDAVTTVSTYAKMDTINGLNLVATTATTPTLDTAKSDDVTITGYTTASTHPFVKSTTITGSTLDLALVNAAASTSDQVVFQYGGDTYAFVDASGNNTLDSTDILVKLTGAINLDLLVQALNA
jgi:hypothetical protein